ncbi:hypothetical protein GPJ56_002056 [Histomonas meleagridis]|uniref:uncharacterized protein n=1 Tax=Histomonas meleagridis TaxID=135588 RepID=UPI00355A27E0|nr:hypothetical protein GPJ56_002056 [Histomonas meleagridis]KAH0800875.1 hypothetical protein GO595_006326 [Histomonas meleagridis]
MNEQQITATLIKVLSSEVKDTKDAIYQTYSSMKKRREKSQEYYQPIKALSNAIQQTRIGFCQQSENCVKQIEGEIEQLKQIQKDNAISKEELQKTTEMLNSTPPQGDDSPLSLAIRSLSAMAPFVLFALISFYSS